MKTLLLDGKPIEKLVPESLPMLIHGEGGSGASFYTVCLAAKWFSLGYDILFLCGYPAAEEEFATQVGREYPNVHFYTKERIEDFKKALASDHPKKTIAIIKNVELFDESVFSCVTKMNTLILSGNFNEPSTKRVLEKPFVTYIYFSPLGEEKALGLQKYEGLVLSGEYRGVTTLAE